MLDPPVALALKEIVGPLWMSMTRTMIRTRLTMILKMEMLMVHRERRKDNASSVQAIRPVASASPGASTLLDIFESILENGRFSVIAVGAFRV